MRAPSRELLEKAAFVLSLVLLAFGYGWVSGEQGWFPDELLERAWQQGDREMAARSSTVTAGSTTSGACSRPSCSRSPTTGGAYWPCSRASREGGRNGGE